MTGDVQRVELEPGELPVVSLTLTSYGRALLTPGPALLAAVDPDDVPAQLAATADVAHKLRAVADQLDERVQLAGAVDDVFKGGDGL